MLAQDAGFITFGQLFTRPGNRRPQRRHARLQLNDRDTTFMHWHPHDGCQHFLIHKRAGLKMPVASGGDPIYPYMATAPCRRPPTNACLAGSFAASLWNS